MIGSRAPRALADEAPRDAQSPAGKVYGEWLIRVKPDQGPRYNELIESKGLPLFREAGGRMVGWWKTSIGDLYEQLTIWEYDDMAAFERAGAALGQNKRFAEFVALRDPLLAGEESRFLRLAHAGEPPKLPEPAAVVVHERHRVPLARMNDYLNYMTNSGAGMLRKHGFRIVGPFIAEVGRWSEVTYLFPFASLAEREKLRAAFERDHDSKAYAARLGEFADEVTTRVLNPLPFSRSKASTAWRPVNSPLLPHLVEVAPGAFAAGFADRHGSANCGWLVLDETTALVDLPRGVDVRRYLAEVERLARKPPRALWLTGFRQGDAEVVAQLLDAGVRRVVTTPGIGAALAEGRTFAKGQIEVVSTQKTVDERNEIELFPLDGIAGRGAAAVYARAPGVLFGGPLVVNGPRVSLVGSHTGRWVEAIERLQALGAPRVVPGFGSWASADPLSRQRDFLTELRRQVGFVISQGQPKEHLKTEVRISSEHLVWAPYDMPVAEDIEQVYSELTVPRAPFDGVEPKRAEGPHALVLYADLPHEPGYLMHCLPRVFQGTGVTPHFTLDVRALSAENLAKVDLLVILRDGLMRPQTSADSDYVWMTQQQQDAVVRFVNQGGAFLNLHNSMGLYPDSGGYLALVGGRYIGHGPLERFRVEVVDHDHPITRGIGDFSVADEQHTPPYDADKVHLLLRNRSDDGQTAAAGWCYEPGKGRLCHLANGHTREALSHPTYERLLRNAIAWCLRRDSPENVPN